MNNKRFLRAALAAGLALGGLPAAHAALTAANTTVSNTASVAYKIGTVDQTPVNSNTSTFVVDRVIDVTVTSDGVVNVVPGATTAYALPFTVTNASNAALDFSLAVAQTSTSTTLSPAAVNDSFDMNNFSYFVDVNGNNTYDPLVDTATSISNLAAGASIKVFAVAKAPITAVNGDIAGVSVLATAKELGGGAITPTVGANTAAMDTVYGDGAGVLGTDAQYDGKYSAYGYYLVASAAITLTKSATVISDPVNGTTNPKAIPGAVVEYCLIVANAGDADASSIVISDNLPAETSYVSGKLYVGVSGNASTCTSGTGTLVTDAADADGGEFATGGTNGSGVVTVRTTTLVKTTGVYRSTFRVTVK